MPSFLRSLTQSPQFLQRINGFQSKFNGIFWCPSLCCQRNLNTRLRLIALSQKNTAETMAMPNQSSIYIGGSILFVVFHHSSLFRVSTSLKSFFPLVTTTSVKTLQLHSYMILQGRAWQPFWITNSRLHSRSLRLA